MKTLKNFNLKNCLLTLAFISPALCASAQDKIGVSDNGGFNSGPATKTQFGIYGQISHYQPNDGFLG